jgi:hypothetical protein
MGDFISEDDLRTFEGWLSKYQGYNPAALTPDELTMWRETSADYLVTKQTSPENILKIPCHPGGGLIPQLSTPRPKAR